MSTERAVSSDMASAFRDAVIEGRYADVEPLLAAYVREIRSPAAATAARDLIEWARRLTLSRKATLAASAVALPVRPRGYSAPSLPSAHTWEVEG